MFGLSEKRVADLTRVGLLVDFKKGTRPANDVAAQGLRLFVPMLQKFKIELVPVSRPGCPMHFCTGILRNETDDQDHSRLSARSLPGGGQGYVAATAALSCLGELAERLSLCSIGLDDPRVFENRTGLSTFDLDAIVGYSSTQMRELGKKHPRLNTTSNDDETVWTGPTKRHVAVVNRSGGTIGQIPSFAALFDEPQVEISGFPGIASSVGCAVWSSMEGARERAFLELVERDAIAQAWYNRLGIKLISKDILGRFQSKKMLNFLEEGRRRRIVLSVATDLDAHVVMALSFLADGSWTAFGSAAGWDVSSAIDGAIREMLQSENSLQMMHTAFPAGDDVDKTGVRVPSALRYARSGSILEDLPLADLPETDEGDLEQIHSFGALQACLRKKGISVWEFDATRSDIKIPCIKLFSPDLCGWEPRFGKSRLFNGVVQRGLRDHPATEAEFAARPFPA